MDPERWGRVEQLYHAAAELGPECREAFLIQACNGDENLQQEVRSLLTQEPSTAELLGGPLSNLAGDSLVDPCWTTSQPGQYLGPYLIEAILGAGGMGEVYRARDIRLGRTVAVKLPRADSSIDATNRLRFQREARAAAALNHPNICAVYDLGEHERQPYLVMEYLQGETLRERLYGGPLVLDELLGLGIQIADALESAHSHGILHRDIKDANVFVTNHHEAKVLDFGIAKVIERAAAGAAQADGSSTSSSALLTETGAAIGTVAYMSPEQARGEKLDARSDLFSFGVLLYQMATGNLPFHGNTPAVIFDAILNSEPISIRHLNPELPRRLERFIHSALEKQRERRIQSAAELREALQGVKQELNSGLLASVKASRHGYLAAACRWPWGAAGIALTLLVGLMVTWFGIRGVSIESLAVMPFENSSGSSKTEYLSDGITESLINSLSLVSNLKVKSRDAVFPTKTSRLPTI